MTNVRCRGSRKEIDLLAVNLTTGTKYHVESSVRTTQKLRKENMNSIAKKKFDHPAIKETIKGFFGEPKYHRWLVIQPQKVDPDLEIVAKEFGIEIRSIEEIVRMIMRKIVRFGSRDDVLRILEIVKLKEDFDRTHQARPIRQPRV
jgi:hypothetical protein